MMKPLTKLLFITLLMLPVHEVSALSWDPSWTERLSSSTFSDQVVALGGDLFCAHWREIQSRLEATLSARDEQVIDYLGGLVENLEDRRGVRDAKREGSRSEADQLRSVGYAKLEEAAANDTEREAVKRYQERVEQALETRRNALDTAVQEYRRSADGLVTERRTVIESARKSFRSSVDEALSAVDRDCSAQTSGVVIAKNFKQALSRAEAKLSLGRERMTVVAGRIKTLAETRKKSVTNAGRNFQTELGAAKAELKTAFGS